MQNVALTLEELPVWISTANRARSQPGGRRRQPLGPIRLVMSAPPEIVFAVIAAPYLGKTPRAMADKLQVIDRGSDLVVADHYTPILGGRFIVTTRETVAFQRPHRIAFRLLHGPVAAVEEEYLLQPAEAGTAFTYQGTLASDLPVLGSWWSRTNARTWTDVVRRSLDDIAAEAARRG
jgi:hypothetical protein